jgi:hypothetical protein
MGTICGSYALKGRKLSKMLNELRSFWPRLLVLEIPAIMHLAESITGMEKF